MRLCPGADKTIMVSSKIFSFSASVMQKAEKRFQAILKKAKQNGVDINDLAKLSITEKLIDYRKYNRKFYVIGAVLLIITGFCFFYNPQSECLFQMPADASKIFRPPENCIMCQDVLKVDKVVNISTEDFDTIYASQAKPVVVSDGTRGWSAVKQFTFDFFRKLYLTNKVDKAACQFFPYKTVFKSLNEALNMSQERAALHKGTLPWYIGWSNCNDAAGKVLRQHYNRPYFLPETSENIALSWIFMGGPGPGAHMHVDNVHYPSWQAQLKGRKKWRLAPPPECWYSCQELEVIVEPGEIIVVDTNRWYHQTHILPGDISITIGSEFD